MKTKNFKTLTLVLGFTALTFSNSLSAANMTGSDSGGGGDASEVRVNEIRSDILEWIKKGGAKALTLPSRISYDEYVLKMSDILTAKKVVIGFVESDDQKNDELKVNVKGTPKTCRGFYSTTDFKPHILCNISRFEATSDSDQYALIHHEYAGLVKVESNEGAASDYEISSQLTDSLTHQTVLKLAVKEEGPTGRLSVEEARLVIDQVKDSLFNKKPLLCVTTNSDKKYSTASYSYTPDFLSDMDVIIDETGDEITFASTTNLRFSSMAKAKMNKEHTLITKFEIQTIYTKHETVNVGTITSPKLVEKTERIVVSNTQCQ